MVIGAAENVIIPNSVTIACSIKEGASNGIGTAGRAAVSVAATGEAVESGWQYWAFTSVGLAATATVTVWVTKIGRDALQKTADVQ